jgi:hypothetical protein
VASVPTPSGALDRRIEALVRQSEASFSRGRQTLEHFTELFEHMSEPRLRAYVQLGRVPVLREAAQAACARRFPPPPAPSRKDGDRQDESTNVPYVPF